MSVQLDHAIVSVRDKTAAARRLAQLLDVPWGETVTGRFTPVYVNEGLTLEFDETDRQLPVQHYCFRVSEVAFDAIFTRIVDAGIAYRSSPLGPVDMTVNERNGGRNIYWDADGVVWEILTVSYARPAV
ncbi:VOC family protein [Marinobacterium sp. YM272]|uniref:VOC family protein n=1 Tax=Marinobacterium sp. YM272 TaxID=3421654 RepID=UPI003D7F37E2